MNSNIFKSQYFSNDQLGFESAYQSLYELVTNPNLPNRLAIYGPWGSGKSEMVKFLDTDLSTAGYATLIFDAWQCRDDERLFASLIKWFSAKYPMLRDKFCFKILTSIAFFLLMSLILSDYVAGVITATLSLIGSVGLYVCLERFFSISKSLCSFFSNPALEKPTSSEEIYNAKKKFQKLLEVALKKKSRKRAIIFIENLDRCLSDRVVDLIEDIANYFDIKSCLFVLVMDKQNVIRAIEKKHSGFDGRTYLEKIVQVGYSMPYPKISTGKGAVTFYKECFTNFRKSISSEEPKENKISYEDFLGQLFKAHVFNTPRKIKKLAENFVRLSQLSKVSEGLDAVTSLIFIIVKDFFPDVYMELLTHNADMPFFFQLASWSLSSDHTASSIRNNPESQRRLGDRNSVLLNTYMHNIDFENFMKVIGRYNASVGNNSNERTAQFIDSLKRTIDFVDLIG